jgi:hypothetical protein
MFGGFVKSINTTQIEKYGIKSVGAGLAITFDTHQ